MTLSLLLHPSADPLLSLGTALVFGLAALGAILLDETNTVATKSIMPGVADNFFKAGPILAYLKSRFTRKWAGPLIQDNYLYKPMKGGAYRKGGTFDITKHQTFSGIQFTPRYYEVNVTEYLEDLEVESAGPTAVFSRLKVDLANAALTLSAILEIACQRHGQNVGVDRTAEINGLEELLTDGTNTTYSGQTFTTYGGQTRADVSPALNSPVGLITPSNTQVSFRVLMHSYLSCVIGSETPKIGVTTNRMFGFIAETFTPQQKVDTVDPEINWPGFKFMNATIVAGQYTVGQDGVNDPLLGDYSATSTIGETFWWLNPGPAGEDSYLRFYIAQSPKFAFGFTGFKGARDDNQVSGQILFAGNLTGRAPRYSRGLFGFVR
jgi:hypothetical protein